MPEILITRRWVQIVTFRSSRFCWTYDYTFNGGRPPAVQIEYGTSLTDLRRVLRRKNPTATITQGWS